MKHSLFFLATTLAFHVSALAQTKVPSLINYQGYVATSAGVPIGNGAPENRTITFRFWKSASDTAAASRLYSESQTVTVLDGDFSVLIGNGAAVDGETNAVANVAGVFANKEVFLGITVDDGNPATTDAEITPRQQLVSTAFAFRATVAESVDNGAISNAMLDANAVNTDQLVASSVTNDKMAASSVTSANIVDGTITSADIGANAVGTIQIAADAVTTDKIAAGSVTTDKIAAGSVNAFKIAPDSITGSRIVDGSIHALDIKDDTIGSVDIKDGSITGTDIANATITSLDIAANAVGTSQLLDGAVTSAKFGADTMQSLEILRIIRGVVKGDGAITSGAGFTVTRTAVGTYTLDFNPNFTGTPTLAITSPASGLPTPAFYVVCSLVSSDATTASRVIVKTSLNAGIVTPFDYGFCFTAIGPR